LDSVLEVHDAIKHADWTFAEPIQDYFGRIVESGDEWPELKTYPPGALPLIYVRVNTAMSWIESHNIRPEGPNPIAFPNIPFAELIRWQLGTWWEGGGRRLGAEGVLLDEVHDQRFRAEMSGNLPERKKRRSSARVEATLVNPHSRVAGSGATGISGVPSHLSRAPGVWGNVHPPRRRELHAPGRRFSLRDVSQRNPRRLHRERGVDLGGPGPRVRCAPRNSFRSSRRLGPNALLRSAVTGCLSLHAISLLPAVAPGHMVGFPRALSCLRPPSAHAPRRACPPRAQAAEIGRFKFWCSHRDCP
jgi:hypothetical protein